jgi:hypothetical protein
VDLQFFDSDPDSTCHPDADPDQDADQDSAFYFMRMLVRMRI